MLTQKIVLITAILSAFVLQLANATDYTWNSGTGNWNDAAKWSPTGIPGPLDNVLISADGPTLTSHTVIQNLSVLSNGMVNGGFNFTINGDLFLNGNTSGGLHTGNGNLIVNGNFVWLEGNLGNAISSDTVQVNGLLLLSSASGFGEHNLLAKTLICNGGVNWQGGFIGISNGAHWIIPTGAVLTENCSSYAEVYNPYSAGGTFENRGQFIRTGNAFLVFGYSFDGTLSFINSGVFISNGAPIQFFGPLHNTSTGTIRGKNTITFNTSFTNEGRIEPGNPVAELSLASSTLIHNQLLDIDISGPAGPGIGNDRLNITGALDIEGSILVVDLQSSYTPPFGTSFHIIQATDSIIGTFSSLVLPSHFMVMYDTNSVSVIKNDPPVCAITQPPYSGYIYYDPLFITIEALALDPNDQVVLVEFFLDGNKIGEDNMSPYSMTGLENLPMGMYTLTAKATDSYGATALSTPVDIVVRCIQQDIDNNGAVNTLDFLQLLASFGNSCSGCPADFNLDGSVNTTDFLSFLSVFGYVCN